MHAPFGRIEQAALVMALPGHEEGAEVRVRVVKPGCPEQGASQGNGHGEGPLGPTALTQASTKQGAAMHGPPGQWRTTDG